MGRGHPELVRSIGQTSVSRRSDQSRTVSRVGDSRQLVRIGGSSGGDLRGTGGHNTTSAIWSGSVVQGVSEFDRISTNPTQGNAATTSGASDAAATTTRVRSMPVKRSGGRGRARCPVRCRALRLPGVSGSTSPCRTVRPERPVPSSHPGGCERWPRRQRARRDALARSKLPGRPLPRRHIDGGTLCPLFRGANRSTGGDAEGRAAWCRRIQRRTGLTA